MVCTTKTSFIKLQWVYVWLCQQLSTGRNILLFFFILCFASYSCSFFQIMQKSSILSSYSHIGVTMVFFLSILAFFFVFQWHVLFIFTVMFAVINSIILYFKCFLLIHLFVFKCKGFIWSKLKSRPILCILNLVARISFYLWPDSFQSIFAHARWNDTDLPLIFATTMESRLQNH